ncbi:hypothetical protein [Phenylobacterium sp.]|jgi:hypothetical protein|uniref:hypothetical protein n=1 Tax=Phenylobacterium sp. TaxID=1871053 RepID=UPI0037C640A7
MPQIAQAWSAIVSGQGYSLTVQAVFVHGRPQVTFTASGNVSGLPASCQCELADLLLVIDDQTAPLPGLRRAALVQAKMIKASGSARLRANDLVQLDLLQNWPTFKMMGAGYNLMRNRDFTAGVSSTTADRSGSYGAIDARSSPPDWLQSLPSSVAGPPPGYIVYNAGQDLGDYFAMMADGVRPTGRRATPGGADDWSYTIDELLNVTGGRALNLASVTRPAQRGVLFPVKLNVPEGAGSTLGLGWELGNHGAGVVGRPTFEGPGERQGLRFVHVILRRAEGG